MVISGKWKISLSQYSLEWQGNMPGTEGTFPGEEMENRGKLKAMMYQMKIKLVQLLTEKYPN